MDWLVELKDIGLVAVERFVLAVGVTVLILLINGIFKKIEKKAID